VTVTPGDLGNATTLAVTVTIVTYKYLQWSFFALCSTTVVKSKLVCYFIEQKKID
jgi:hypothetical protein